jgi:hypothetical protein
MNHRTTNELKENTMATRMIAGIALMMIVFTVPGISGEKDGLKKYFNDAATAVRSTEDPAQKRAILNNSLENMSSALKSVQQYSTVTANDKQGLKKFASSIAEKQDELMGRNGYTRVPDAKMNAFADYLVQDMEQAEVISISLVTLLLIIIILLLIAH